MLSSEIAQQIAQGLPYVSEKPHFDSNGFYANKRIFATVWHDKNEVNVRLTPEQQQAFVAKKPKAFCQIPNAWGRQGWTTIALAFVDRKLFTAALTAAWEQAAVKTTRAPRPRRKAKSPRR